MNLKDLKQIQKPESWSGGSYFSGSVFTAGNGSYSNPSYGSGRFNFIRPAGVGFDEYVFFTGDINIKSEAEIWEIINYFGLTEKIVNQIIGVAYQKGIETGKLAIRNSLKDLLEID